MPFDLNDPFSTLPIATGQILANLLVALGCGLVVSLLYRWSYRGTSYSATFVASLIPLAMVTAVVIMAIGNNLARAFGLVGAMSIIRFRTAIKDTQDLVFIFLSLAIGLAAGVGFHRLAILATVLVGGVLWVFGRFGFGSTAKTEFLVELVVDGRDGEGGRLPAWERLLDAEARRHRLLHARTGGGGDLTLAFLVTLARSEQAPSLARALGDAEGVHSVTLYHDEERPL